MSKKNISQEKIIQAFLGSAFEKSAGATSLADVADRLEIKKASLYNHFDSREAMYDASLVYCENEIGKIRFLADKALESIKNGKNSVQGLFKKLVSRYFGLFDSEPLFKMYVFIHTEQYFNQKALRIFQMQTEILNEDVKKIIKSICEIQENEMNKKLSDKEQKEVAICFSSLILQQLDAYIAVRKETVRQNPETGAGSLFELPSDNNIINRSSKLIEEMIVQFFNK